MSNSHKIENHQFIIKELNGISFKPYLFFFDYIDNNLNGYVYLIIPNKHNDYAYIKFPYKKINNNQYELSLNNILDFSNSDKYKNEFNKIRNTLEEFFEIEFTSKNSDNHSDYQKQKYLENLINDAFQNEYLYMKNQKLIEDIRKRTKKNYLYTDKKNYNFSIDFKNEEIIFDLDTMKKKAKIEIIDNIGNKESKIEPKIINSWNDFEENIKNLDNDYYFRGQSNHKWEIRSSFYRTIENLELYYNLNYYKEYILYKFSTYYLSSHTNKIFDLDDEMDFRTILNIAQHYGFPTPLIDWTESPYVALFFALKGLKNEYEYARVYAIKKNIFENYSEPIILKDIPPKIYFLNIPSIYNERAFPQQAISCYSIFNNFEYYVKTIIEPIYKKNKCNEDIIKCYDIPIKLADDFLKKLNLMNINEATLFPGLEGICQTAKRNLFKK
jgi:hypothetical protein